MEDHLKKLREEETGEDDGDEAGWENWEVETDSSTSESEGWIDVSSDDEDLEVSDSEDEAPVQTKGEAQTSSLATSKVGVTHCCR